MGKLPQHFTTLAIGTGAALNLYGAGKVDGKAVSEEPPNRLVVCSWGESQADDHKLYVNETTQAAMAKYNAHPWDRVAVDFEHALERPEIPHPKPVAAYGSPRCIPGEGIVLENMEWTPAGAEAWKARSYSDLSPVISKNKNGEILFIKSAALTTNGKIQGLHLYSALTLPNTNQLDITEPDFMDYKKLLITLMIALGATTLTETASDEEITAAAEELGKKEKAEPEAPAEAGATSNMSADVKSLHARLDKHEKDAETNRKNAAVTAATQEGKVIAFSAEEIALLPETVLYSHIAKLTPGTVPTQSQLGHAKSAPGASLTVDADEEAALKLMSAQMGISPEDIKTYAAK